MPATRDFLWRGVQFKLISSSDHSGEARYESLDKIWTVWRLSKEGPWYARLRVQRQFICGGKGRSKAAALDASYQDAADLHHLLASKLEAVNKCK